MPRPIKTANTVAALFVAAALMFPASTGAVLADPQAKDTPNLSDTTQADLQALRDAQSRAAFQQQQQNFRQQDRVIVGAPQPRPNVPIMQPSGQSQIFGNSYAR